MSPATSRAAAHAGASRAAGSTRGRPAIGTASRWAATGRPDGGRARRSGAKGWIRGCGRAARKLVVAGAGDGEEVPDPAALARIEARLGRREQTAGAPPVEHGGDRPALRPAESRPDEFLDLG